MSKANKKKGGPSYSVEVKGDGTKRENARIIAWPLLAQNKYIYLCLHKQVIRNTLPKIHSSRNNHSSSLTENSFH